MQGVEGHKAGDQQERRYHCRGCGQGLPSGCRRHFHKECLRHDKRRRIFEQRRREQERFRRWLGKQLCPHCGDRYDEQLSDVAIAAPCEASQAIRDAINLRVDVQSRKGKHSVLPVPGSGKPVLGRTALEADDQSENSGSTSELAEREGFEPSVQVLARTTV
jgi:hypothetical protein